MSNLENSVPPFFATDTYIQEPPKPVRHRRVKLSKELPSECYIA